MKNVKPLFIAVVLTLALALSAIPAFAQGGGDACDALMEDVLENLVSDCADLGDMDACLASGPVTVAFRDGANEGIFEASGDILPTGALATFAGSAANDATETVGLARITTFDANGSALNLVPVGMVDLTDRTALNGGLTTCPVTNTSGGAINLRLGPNTGRGIAGLFDNGQTALATGVSETGDWVRIQRDGVVSWGFVDLLDVACDPSLLPEVEDDENDMMDTPPMTAILVNSGADSMCGVAPNGLLVYNENSAAQMQINGVGVEVQGAIFVSTTPDTMTIASLRGEITLFAGDQEIELVPGQASMVPLADGLRSDAPGAPATADDLTAALVLAGVVADGGDYEDLKAAYAEGSASVDSCEVANNSGGSLNLRMGPSSSRGIAGLFPSGEVLEADGRNEAGDWVRVERQGITGWVFVDLVELQCAASALPVVE